MAAFHVPGNHVQFKCITMATYTDYRTQQQKINEEAIKCELK